MICSTCQYEVPSGLRCDCGRLHCPDCYALHHCPRPETPWPHQVRGAAELRAAIAAGEKAICVTSPTGGGKTRMQKEFVAEAVADGKQVIIYTHRKLLTHQTSGVFSGGGVDHGIMAAGWEPALLRSVQVASVWTVNSRVFKSKQWALPESDYVLIDEAHGLTGETMQKIAAAHVDQGAVLIGWTATPVGIAGMYSRLIIAGKNSELRKCNAHVKCLTYGPDEPDLRHIKKIKIGEDPSEEVNRKAIMVQGVFGRVLDNWRRLNPEGLPTLLFAPGVAESRWFAEQFTRTGIPAAHIDAETPEDEREAIIDGSKDGSVKVICNRFVMREGVDMPWLGHCIMATVFGALSSFLQAGGRLLRAYPGLDAVTLQDHGGNWHRHGSLNADRDWTLGDTDKSIAKGKQKVLQDGLAKEPIVCPKCGGVRAAGPKCPYCGHEHVRSVRCVVQSSGELKRLTGSVVKKKKQRSDEEKQAAGLFYAAANGRMTVAQLAGIYYRKYETNFPDGVLRCGGVPVVLPSPSSVEWDRRVGVVFPQAVRRKKEAMV